MKKILPRVLFFVLFFFSSYISVFAENLLSNPGFENDLSNWGKNGGNFSIVTDSIHSGNKAVNLTSSGSTTARYIFQAIPVISGKTYKASMFAKVYLGNSNVYLKISLYNSNDGSGSENSNVFQSETINNPSSFTDFNINYFTIPEEINSIKVKGYLDPQDTSQTVVLFDDFLVEETIASTLTPTSIPTQIFTSTPSLLKTTYKINDAKDSNGTVLSSVKIYVDDRYIHHYVSETLTFCDNCTCEEYYDCSLGEHTFRLEKTGYSDWNDTKTININDTYEINPIMNLITPTSVPTPTYTPTPTSKLNPTPSPSQKPTLKPTIKITPTINKDKIKDSSSSSKLVSPTKTQGMIKGVKTEAGLGKDLPKILIIIGILSILAMIVTSFVIPKISH